MRIALYFFSGLLIICGVACFGIFYHSGSVQAIGGAMMFLCFGFAGFLVATFSEQILNALKSGNSSSRSA